MQAELDVTPSKFIKKFAQESMMQNMQRNRLDWENTSSERRKGITEWLNFVLSTYYFGETVAKSPQISEKDLCKWDDIKYLPTEDKEFH